MKLNIYFRANESAKSAGSVNKDITKEAYRIGTHTKTDILKAVWLSVNNSGVTNEDHMTVFCDAVSAETEPWMLSTLETPDFQFSQHAGVRDATGRLLYFFYSYGIWGVRHPDQ